MQTTFMIASGVVIGALVGALHFGGLVWTVQRLVSGGHPGVVALSFMLRMTVTALALIAVAVLAPLAVIGVVPGMIGARVALTQQARNGPSNGSTRMGLDASRAEEVSDG